MLCYERILFILVKRFVCWGLCFDYVDVLSFNIHIYCFDYYVTFNCKGVQHFQAFAFSWTSIMCQYFHDSHDSYSFNIFLAFNNEKSEKLIIFFKIFSCLTLFFIYNIIIQKEIESNNRRCTSFLSYQILNNIAKNVI